MDKAHVNREFTRLVARNWQPVELDALTASIWESPVTDAERKLSQECDNYNEGTSWKYQQGGRRNGKPRDKRVTFLPVFRYLRGEFDA